MIGKNIGCKITSTIERHIHNVMFNEVLSRGGNKLDAGRVIDTMIPHIRLEIKFNLKKDKKNLQL